MTVRLEQAIRGLSPQDVERVAKFAESLAQAGTNEQANHLQLDWAGAAEAAYPEYESGVDAAHAAMRLMGEAIDRGLSR
jgi:hypothetical protein